MAETIIDKVNRLAEWQAQKDLLELDKAAQLKQLIPADIAQLIADLEFEYGSRAEALQANIEELTIEIRLDVLDSGESIRGAHLDILFVPGKLTWDTNRLLDLMQKYPELVDCYKQGKSYTVVKNNKR